MSATYKVQGNTKSGYWVVSPRMGIDKRLSHHDSRERATQAMQRYQDKETMKAWK